MNALDKSKRRKANRQLRKAGERPITAQKQRADQAKWDMIKGCNAIIDDSDKTVAEKAGARKRLKGTMVDWQNRGTANVKGSWSKLGGSKPVAIPLDQNTFVFPTNFKAGK